ncbi:MAG: deoxynucleoside kinase [Promethearchaeota archaeon]
MSKTVYRNKGSKDNIVISIAGAHGTGKTTIVNLMKKKYQDNNKFKFFPERYRKIPPFPFGSSDKQIAFRSEIHFLQQLILRNKSVLNYDEKYNGRILFLDRTPICILIYSKSLNLKEKDYNLILDTYKSIPWREDFVIYLAAKPETILKRIIQRGSLDSIRLEWNEKDKSYLLKILTYYNKFLLSNKNKDRIFIIETDKLNPDEVVRKIEQIITKLSGYSFDKMTKIPPSQMSILNFLKER